MQHINTDDDKEKKKITLGDGTATIGAALNRVIMESLSEGTCSRKSQLPEDVREEHSR